MRPRLVAFAAGVWLLQQQPALPGTQWLWLLPLALTPLVLPEGRTGMQRYLRRFLVVLACAALGFAWAGWRAQLRLADSLPSAWEGVDVRVAGVVAGLPDRDAHGERFDFRVEQVLTPGAKVPARLRLSWAVPEWMAGKAPQRVRAGERWQFGVRLKQPHGTANPDGFDYEAWLLQKNIRATGYVREKAGVARLGESRHPLDLIQRLREDIRTRIAETLAGHAQAGVITALAVGDQNAIPHANWRVYNRTGTSHLMSISGLHITLFAALAGGLAHALWRRVPALVLRLPARRAALLVGWLAALAYTLLAGFQIPAQRTLFMLTVLVAGLWLRREPRPASLLLLALAIVLLPDPWAVLAPGFWLSFGALAAMMWAVQGMLGSEGKVSAWMRTQAAVTIALAPALLLLFHQVSLISPLANALAIPVVSMGVVPLALAGVLVPPLLQPAAWLMQGVEAVLQWLSAFDWAAWALPAAPPWALALALSGVAWMLMPALPRRWLGGFMCLPLLFPAVGSPAPGSFEAEVLDVGQGTAILVRTAGHTLLYDTGPALGDNNAGEQIVLPRLRALGITRLDGLILTHDDLDHTGGAAAVMRDTEPRWLLTSLRAGHVLLNRPFRPCVRGQRWQWDGVDFEVLNPPAHAYARRGRRDNDMSCVLKISRGAQSLLLTADAERIGELEMTERVAERLPSAVLVAGHHGSRTSSIEEFVSRVQPRHVVFTVGYRNRYGHPHPEVLRRFAQTGAVLHRSDRHGWLRLRFADGGIAVERWRERYRRYWQHAPVE
ncbi:MAG: DNA internalization-related competence protein ComEC/Rec2 [Pseudomonadota bacterium]